MYIELKKTILEPHRPKRKNKIYVNIIFIFNVIGNKIIHKNKNNTPKIIKAFLFFTLSTKLPTKIFKNPLTEKAVINNPASSAEYFVVSCCGAYRRK